MVNRQGSSAGKPPRFEGTAEVTRKLPDIPVDHGEGFAALGRLFDTVGSNIGAMADVAAAREGADAGTVAGRDAFENLKPLALRRDGTIRGDAMDKAATSALEWRALAQFHEGLMQAHTDAQGDPGAFDAAVGKLTDRMAVFSTGDVALDERLRRQMTASAEPYRRSLYTQRAGRIEEERRSAADEAMSAGELDLAKKAYLAGSDPGSSRALEGDVARAKASIDAAESDGVITPGEAVRRKKTLSDKVVEARLRGVFDALPDAASKTAWADGLRKRWAENDPALAGLDRDRVEGLMAHMRGAARSDEADQRLRTALDRRVLERQLADDVASVRETGTPTEGADARDPAHVAAMLGPVEAAKWGEQRRAAEVWYAAASDLGRLSNEDLAARVGDLEPKAGEPDYAAKAKLHAEVAAKATAILKTRAEDPARAVDDAVKGVRDAKASLDPTKPETFDKWVSMRLSAQTALGIPALAQRPLTDAEARALMEPVTKAPAGQEMAAFKAVAADVAKRYGPHADVVTRQLLAVKGVDDATALAGQQFVAKLWRGEAARREAARVDVSTEADKATKAMAPSPAPTPLRPVPGRSIDLLRADPKLAPQFDAKYGDGTAKFYLDQTPGTTTTAPDGTEGWKP